VSMTKKTWLLAGVASLALVFIGAEAFLASPAVDGPATAARIVASLAERCPMTTPGDVAAFDACRTTIGQGPEGEAVGSGSLLWGGEQPNLALKDKNLTWFRGDLFMRMYMSLYMFTGE
jgi:hypothetical protein